MSINTNFLESCIGYITCGIAYSIQDINWMTLGAVVLLLARLLTDVPKAYDSVRARIKRYRGTKDDKSK